MANKKISALSAAASLAGTELVEVVQGGSNVQTTAQAIADLAASSSGASLGVQYTADLGSTADSDPGAGLLKWNNATQAAATELYLDDASSDGADLTGWWSALTAGGFAYLQHATDQDVWQIWEITTVTDASGYVKLAVSLLAQGNDFADDDPMRVTLQQGAGTGGTVSSVNGDTGTVIVQVPSGIAVSDETTALTAGTAKVTFRMPFAMTLTAPPRASLSTAQATNGAGGILTVDINEAGVSILSTKLTIDNTEKTSTTAATPAVLSDTSLADDAEITVDIDQVGDGTAKGLKIWLIGYPT